MAKRMMIYFFFISLLVHVFLFLLYFYYINKYPFLHRNQILEKQNQFISVYSLPSPMSVSASSSIKSHVAKKNINNPNDYAGKTMNETVKDPPKKMHANIRIKTANAANASLFSSSLNFLKNQQLDNLAKSDDSEPIFLIGEGKEAPNLLIRLLASALSRHFYYPSHASKFGIKGKTLVKFTLLPNGVIENIHIIQSSSVEELDTAALYAANTAPTIKGADRFITKPKSFVVGFVFH